MTAEQRWSQLQAYLVERRDHLRNTEGKLNKRGSEIDLALEKMQQLDSTIKNESIYFNGTEFYPTKS